MGFGGFYGCDWPEGILGQSEASVTNVSLQCSLFGEGHEFGTYLKDMPGMRQGFAPRGKREAKGKARSDP